MQNATEAWSKTLEARTKIPAKIVARVEHAALQGNSNAEISVNGLCANAVKSIIDQLEELGYALTIKGKGPYYNISWSNAIPQVASHPYR